MVGQSVRSTDRCAEMLAPARARLCRADECNVGVQTRRVQGQVMGAASGHGLGRQYIEPMLPRTLLPRLCAVCRGWARTRICDDGLQRHAAPRPRCSVCTIALPDGRAVCGA
jgi:hypothetical protein